MAHRPDPPSEESLEEGYEQRDVAFGRLLRWIGAYYGFAAFMALISLGLWFLFVPRGSELLRERPILGVGRVPEQPRLQAHPIQDLQEFRQGEEARLDSYGVQADGDGRQTLRIPIERAVQLTLQEGLRTQATPPPTGPVRPAETPVEPVAPAPGATLAPEGGIAPREHDLHNDPLNHAPPPPRSGGAAPPAQTGQPR